MKTTLLPLFATLAGLLRSRLLLHLGILALRVAGELLFTRRSEAHTSRDPDGRMTPHKMNRSPAW